MVEKLRSLASQQRSFDMKIAEAELWISEKQAEVEFLPLPSSAFEAEQRSKDIIALLDDVNGIACNVYLVSNKIAKKRCIDLKKCLICGKTKLISNMISTTSLSKL